MEMESESTSIFLSFLQESLGVSLSHSSSVVVCTTCNDFLVNLQHFCVQVREVDKMYKELFSGGCQEGDLRELRQKYGLGTSERTPIKNEMEDNEIVSQPEKRRREYDLAFN